MQHPTNKRNCLITGCSGYIGSYIAKHLADQNWQIWGISRKNEVALANPTINWIIGDLLDPVKLDEITKSLSKNYSFDAIIHCLGFSPDNTILNLDANQFKQSLISNFSAIQKINSALTTKLSKNSSIIHLGSRVAVVGNPGQIAYGTAKGILIDYTKLLAKELGPQGTTVNLILPGVHPSDILGPHRQQIMDTAKQSSFLQKLTDIEDVVNAVTYLINARSVTGQIFSIESRLVE